MMTSPTSATIWASIHDDIGDIRVKYGASRSRTPMLWGSAKRKQGPGLIGSQSEIKDVKVLPHVSAVCRSSERQHPELESETIYYLGNRLVVAIGNFGHAW